MSFMRDYDSWKTTNPYEDIEPKVMCQCEMCDDDLYEGEERLKTDAGWFCSTDCFLNFMLEEMGGSEEVLEREEE